MLGCCCQCEFTHWPQDPPDTFCSHCLSILNLTPWRNDNNIQSSYHRRGQKQSSLSPLSKVPMSQGLISRPYSSGCLTAGPYPQASLAYSEVTLTMSHYTVSQAVASQITKGESENASHVVVIPRPYLMIEGDSTFQPSKAEESGPYTTL